MPPGVVIEVEGSSTVLYMLFTWDYTSAAGVGDA
jgi:hypothetical protein